MVLEDQAANEEHLNFIHKEMFHHRIYGTTFDVKFAALNRSNISRVKREVCHSEVITDQLTNIINKLN